MFKKHRYLTILAIVALAIASYAGLHHAGAALAAPAQGYNTCGAVTDDTVSGDTTWVNVTRMQGANDASYATISLNNSSSCDFVSCQTYAFAIPTSATINGVEVLIRNKCNATASGTLHSIRIQKNGTAGGTDKSSSATTLTTSDRDDTYGSGSDLWGNALTPADINANNTGTYLNYSVGGATARTISVDSVQMRVTYTAATTDTSKFMPFFTWLRIPLTYTATQTRTCHVIRKAA